MLMAANTLVTTTSIEADRPFLKNACQGDGILNETFVLEWDSGCFFLQAPL